MDPVMIEKLQAMKRYRKSSFLHRLAKSSLSIFFSGMFLSCPLWLPKVHSLLVRFIFIPVPDLRAIILGPKCLFFICTVIVMFLVGDSKRLGGAPVADIYEEYARRNKRNNIDVVKVHDDNVMRVKEEDEEEEEEEEEEEKEEEVEEMESEEDGRVGEEEEEEPEETGLPAEELNRRVEDFIAKVNRQRRMEARVMVCGGRGRND